MSEQVAETFMAVASPLSFFSAIKALVTSPRRMAAFFVSLWLTGKITGNELVRLTKDRRVVFFFPMFVYDLTARLAWFINYLINLAPKLQPSCPDWNSDKAIGPSEIANAPGALTQEQLAALRADILARKDRRFEEKAVVQLFDTLTPASNDAMIGKTWNGWIVRTTSVLDLASFCLVRPLQMLGFNWGKRYRTQFVGDPLLVRWMDLIYFPLPAWGNVQIQEIDYRGKNQATMRYDHQPWSDYFRVLDDGSESGQVVMLGVWCAREKNGGWFTLTFEPNVQV